MIVARGRAARNRAGTYLVQRFAPRLGRVKVGSAAVTFRRLADVDRDALHEMLERARDLTGGGS